MAKQAEEKFIDKVLDLAHCLRPMLSADADPRNYFPAGITPYPNQDDSMEETYAFLSNPSERVMVKIIPTAGGKSPDAAAATRAWTAAGGISAIICPNKELQGQYQKDFGQKELSIITGGVEFQCNRFPGLSCGAVKARKGCGDRKIKQEDSQAPNLSKICKCPYRSHLFEAAENVKTRPMCFTPHSFDAFRKNRLVSGAMPKGDGLLIVDEAHLLEDQLRDFLSISVRVDLVERLLCLDPELGGFTDEFFYQTQGVRNDEHLPVTLVKEHQTIYLGTLRDSIKRTLDRLERLLQDHELTLLATEFAYLDTPEMSVERFDRHKEVLEKIVEKLDFILTTTDETHWVVELTRSTASADDVEAQRDDGQAKTADATSKAAAGSSGSGGYAVSRADESPEEAAEASMPPLRLLLRPTVIPASYLKSFFSGFSKIILMSGTLFGVHMKLLGLSAKDAENPFGEARLFQTGSRINVSRRKIWIDNINGRDVSSRGNNLEESFRHFTKYVIERVVPRLPGEKGIIHVSSKKQAELFVRLGNELARQHATEDGGRLPAEFVTPGRRMPWKELYRKFKERPPGGANLFLVAARRYEGIDLVGDLARICIMAKMPYPHTKDTMISALEHVFPGYTATVTLVSFIQGMNRCVRKPNDWALNICLDTLAFNLMRRYGNDLPEHVKDSIGFPEYADWIDHWQIPDPDAKAAARKRTQAAVKAQTRRFEGP